MADIRLQREKLMSATGAALFLFASISGLAFWLFEGHGAGRQWVMLLHLLAGSGFALMMLPYIPLHFLRTGYFRRPSLIVSGLLMSAALTVLALSGAILVWSGQQESAAWLPIAHLLSGALLIGLTGLHLFDHFFRMPEQRKRQYPQRFLAFAPGRAGLSLLLSLTIVGALFVVDVIFPHDTQAVAAAVPFEAAYGEHPFRPSQTETSHGGFVTSDDIAGSDKCAACHQEIAQQWSSSLHRQAASDPAYVTNINLLVEQKGISATRYCEGCHAPEALLTGQLSPGGLHGGIEGTTANLEGVSCLSCHGVTRMVHLKGVASYEFTPRSPYLFEAKDFPLASAVNQLLIRTDPAQHKRDMGNQLLQDPALCAGCHAQFMDADLNDWGWVKMQDEYSAWLAGPFSGHDSEFSATKVQRCQDCHMPKVKANDPSADANGLVASHNFPGGNTVIPLLAGDQDQYEATVAMLQNNGMRLTINRPNRPDAQQNQRSINEQIRGNSEAPFYVYLNEDITLDVIVANQGVGHDFPAGTIDLGEAWLDVSVLDAEGDIVFGSGNAVLGDALPDGTHMYKSIVVDRQGREVWRHDLFNMVGESFRRVIPAGEADLASYQFTIPGWTKTPLTVSATLRYRKLNERYAKFALAARYFPVPIIDVAWDSLLIPVRIRSEIDRIDQNLSSQD
ncbi:MAG: hypothetical protein ACI82A_001637 [Candidatus Azotimanducaceae bacterium]|jgi:hypothetical protein